MSEQIYEYLGQRFRPREGAEQELLLFVAPAKHIRSWAGVPRKAFDYQHGFQRTLNPARVSEVAAYFQEDSKLDFPHFRLDGRISRVPRRHPRVR